MDGVGGVTNAFKNVLTARLPDGASVPFPEHARTSPAAPSFDAPPEAVRVCPLDVLVSSVRDAMAGDAGHYERVQARVRPEAALKLLI